MINHSLKTTRSFNGHTKEEKNFLPNYNGDQPPNPRSLAHYGPKYEKVKGRT